MSFPTVIRFEGLFPSASLSGSGVFVAHPPKKMQKKVPISLQKPQKYQQKKCKRVPKSVKRGISLYQCYYPWAEVDIRADVDIRNFFLQNIIITYFLGTNIFLVNVFR